MSAGRFTVFGSATTLRDDFPGAAALFAECFTRPTFPAGRVRQGAAACPGRDRPPGRQSAPGNQRVLLRQPAGRLAVPRHPGRQGRVGARSSRPRTCRQYHAKYFVPNNMIVTVFGDIDPDEALALVKKQFGGLKADPDFQPISFDRPQRHRQDDRPPQARSASRRRMVMFGYPTASIFEKEDYAAMTLLGAIMAGYQLSGRMAAQRAARRGAGVLRPCLADDRPRAGLLRRSSPRRSPTRSTRSSRGSSATWSGRKRARSAKTSSARPSRWVIALHAQENTTIAEQAQQAGARRAVRPGLRLSQDVRRADRGR